jgi:tRNA 2-thiouridine synthesizing protein D
MLNYCLLVTGPAYGSQQASSAWQFAQALLAAGHRISCVFFYREGVLNANQLTSPANDEFDLVRAWVALAQQHDIELNVCVAAALRRGVADEQEAEQLKLVTSNLQAGFTLSGLGSLAEAALSCDRLVQF